MIGGISEGFANYLAVLRRVESHKTPKTDLKNWLMSQFDLEETYARNVATTLLFGTGLITVQDGDCVVSETGRAILQKPNPGILYRIFAEQFIGITDLVEILAEIQPKDWDELFAAWHMRVSSASKPASKWSTNHAKMQFRHRLDWLCSLGIISELADGYYLSKSGMEETLKQRIKGATQQDEAVKIRATEDASFARTAPGQPLEFDHPTNVPGKIRQCGLDSFIRNRFDGSRVANLGPAALQAGDCDECLVSCWRNEFLGHGPLKNPSNAIGSLIHQRSTPTRFDELLSDRFKCERSEFAGKDRAVQLLDESDDDLVLRDFVSD